MRADELLASELVLPEVLLPVEELEASELLFPPAAELVSAAEELLGFLLLVLFSEESCDEEAPFVELGVEELLA